MRALVADRSKFEIEQRYDRIAENELLGRGLYEESTRAKGYFRGRKLETAILLGKIKPGSRILEIGCAVGQYTLAMARRGYQMTGLDIALNSIRVAQNRARKAGITNIQFFKGDAEQLGFFGNDSFDAVVSFSTLRYVPRPERALMEMRRVLKPGGCAVVDFPNRCCPWFYVKQWLGSEQHPFDRWYTVKELRRLFRGAGLQWQGYRTILFTPTVAPDLFLPFFKAADAVAERTPFLRRLAGIFMVAATK